MKADLAPVRAKGIVHKVIAEVAKGLAGEFWEQMATGARPRSNLRAKTRNMANKFYRRWPNRETFVALNWSGDDFISAARQSLVLLLGKPGFSEVAKAEIKEALELDGLINPKALSAEAAAAELTRSVLSNPKR